MAKLVIASAPYDRTVTLRVSSQRSFLKTPINDPKEQGEVLKNLARNFVFPLPGKNLPITAIRRIAHVSLASKILARIQLHPVSHGVTETLHSIMNVKVQNYFNEPFAPSPLLLTSPYRRGALTSRISEN